MKRGLILKRVNWLIDYPLEEDCENDDANSQRSSTGFFIKQPNGETIRWFLEVHFNYKNSGMIAVLVYPLYDSSVTLEVTVWILDQYKAMNNRTVTSRDCMKNINSRSNTYEFKELMPVKEIHTEGNCFAKAGCIHLVVVIRDLYQEITHNEVNSKSANEFFNLLIQPFPNDTVTLVSSDGEGFKMNKSILTEKSEYFKNNLSESNATVRIKNFNGKAVREFLRFLCIGYVCSLDPMDKKMIEMASYYQVKELRNLCLDSIAARIDEANVCEMIRFADKLVGAYSEDILDFCVVAFASFFHLERRQDVMKAEFSSELADRVERKFMSLYMDDEEDGVFKSVKTLKPEQDDSTSSTSDDEDSIAHFEKHG